MANFGSNIYKPLEANELARIVRHSIDRSATIVESRLMSGGLFNTTYYVQTANPAKRLVLRVAPIRKELLFDFEKVMMGIEPLMYARMREAGVPIPTVVCHDNTCSVISREYIIVEYLDSMPLSDPSFPVEWRDSIQHELGKYTARIHSIKANRFGWPLPDGTVNGSASWMNELGRFCREISDRCANHHVLTDSEIRAFDDVFRDNMALFTYDDAPSLVHNDLWAPNILVRQHDGRWGIAALIDADRAMYADPEFEFVLWENEPHFMTGYGKPLDMTAEGTRKRKFYSVALNLFGAYVYKVQYNQDTEYQMVKKAALEAINEL